MNEKTKAEVNEVVEYEVIDEIKEEMEELDPRMAIAKKYYKATYGEEKEEKLGDVPTGETATVRVNGEMTEVPIEDTVKVKVDGKEKDVLKEKVDAAGGVEVYQKIVAADARLKEAGEERKKLQAGWSELEVKQQQLDAMEKRISELNAQEQDLSVSDDQKEIARKYREALFEGDDEEADILLLQLTAKKDAPATLNEEELISKVTESTTARIKQGQYEDEVDKINAKFEEDYPEIVKDPRLMELAENQARQLQREGKIPLSEIMTTVGDEVMEWRGTVTPSTTLDEKREAKRASSIPKAGSGRAKAPPPPKQQSNAEYVESLKKARGQG